MSRLPKNLTKVQYAVLAHGSVECPAGRNEEGRQGTHAHNPSKVGETTGEVRFRAGRDVATIRLANGELTYIPVDQLESLPRQEGRIEAFASGRTGGPVELARQLLLEKVSGDLTDVYYSMGSGKAKFYPHQFRPVAAREKPRPPQRDRGELLRSCLRLHLGHHDARIEVAQCDAFVVRHRSIPVQTRIFTGMQVLCNATRLSRPSRRSSAPLLSAGWRRSHEHDAL